jgi:integrase/recombinase XerD
MSIQIITKFHAYLLTEKMVSLNTFSAYKRDTDQFIHYITEQKKELTAIEIDDVKSYVYELKERLHLTARSITRKISALKVLFLYLQEYHGGKNLAQDLIFPKLEKKLPQYLSEEQVKQLLQAVEHDNSENKERNKVLLFILYVTGMRISELISLQLSHFHFDTGILQVKGKGGKMRMIPIPASIMQLIKEYIMRDHQKFTQKNNRHTEFLFPIFYGGVIKHITRQAVWIILKQLCKKSGIAQSIFPHQLRHSLATHMLKNGADLRSLQLLLGHENVSTVQIYTHLETSYLRQIYDKKHPRS